VLKKTNRLAEYVGINPVSQIGDGSETGILNLRGAKVFSQGFAKKENEQGDCEDRPDVMDASRKKIIEIENVAIPRKREKRQTGAGGAGVQDEIHRELDHQGYAAFGHRHKGEQNYAKSQPEGIGPNVTQQSPQLR
jgi:hypothetical protein